MGSRLQAGGQVEGEVTTGEGHGGHGGGDRGQVGVVVVDDVDVGEVDHLEELLLLLLLLLFLEAILVALKIQEKLLRDEEERLVGDDVCVTFVYLLSNLSFLQSPLIYLILPFQ